MTPELATVRAAVLAGWRLDVAQRPGGAWADLGDVVVHATGLPAAQWNGGHVTGPRPRLDLVGSFFAERSLPWGVLLPAELELRPPGLDLLRDQPLMTRPLPAPAPAWPSGLTVRGDAPAADVAAVQAAAFGDDPDLALAFVAPQATATWSRFLTAYDGGDPVGTAQVVLAGASAGVYGVAVVEGQRGRGLGAALTAGVLELASAAGFSRAHLNPSELGRGVYARLGFRDLTPWRIWVPR